jgi:hypothetical protein
MGDAASGAGFVAATIAIFGFLGQIWPALRRQADPDVRAATVIGGLVGLLGATLLLIASYLW